MFYFIRIENFSTSRKMQKIKDLTAYLLARVPRLLLQFIKKNMSRSALVSPAKVTQPENLLPRIPWVHVAFNWGNYVDLGCCNLVYNVILLCKQRAFFSSNYERAKRLLQIESSDFNVILKKGLYIHEF